MKGQATLHGFFHIKAEISSQRKYFIYDPANRTAFFASQPVDSDTFVIRKSGLQLYLRSMQISTVDSKTVTIDLTSDDREAKDIKINERRHPLSAAFTPDQRQLSVEAGNVPITVHKSNLQKAIRRGVIPAALFSTWSLLHLDPMELFRRLPIICLEDVCLLSSVYPILIWWMIADKVYLHSTMWTFYDVALLLQLVQELCLIHNSYYPDEVMASAELPECTHESIEQLSLQDHEIDALLAIYYRSKYGGMPGDMRLLERSIHYYTLHPQEMRLSSVFTSFEQYPTLLWPRINAAASIPRTINSKVSAADRSSTSSSVKSVDSIILPALPSVATLNTHCYLLDESLDFHPYPQLISTVLHGISRSNNGISMNSNLLKELIWTIESGPNIRKVHTLLAADAMQKEASIGWNETLWPILNRVRKALSDAVRHGRPLPWERPSNERGDRARDR